MIVGIPDQKDFQWKSYASYGIWLQIKDLVAVGLDANCVLSWMSIYRVINKNGRQQLLKVQFFVSNKFIIDRVFLVNDTSLLNSFEVQRHLALVLLQIIFILNIILI